MVKTSLDFKIIENKPLRLPVICEKETTSLSCNSGEVSLVEPYTYMSTHTHLKFVQSRNWVVKMKNLK